MLSKKLSSLGLRWFTRLYKDELIDAAYQGILGRAPVAEEKNFHAEALARTADIAQPLRALSRSDELAFQLPYTKILEHRKSAHRAYLKSLPHTSTSNQNILLLGNCQARALGRLMQAMLGAADTTAIELLPEVLTRLEARDSVLSQQIAASDLIYVHPHAEALRILEQNYPQDYRKVRLVPRITFSAFHPDIDYVEDAAHNQVHGPIGAYQSSLVFFGWKNGLSASETMALFCGEVYESLGYFVYRAASRELLVAEGELAGLPLDGLIDKWSRRGCWMHSMNHPKLFPLADIARGLLERDALETLSGVEEFVEDEMNFETVWPVYPEIAEMMGVVGHYAFKRPTDSTLRGMPVQMMTLAQFVEESFAAYSRYEKDELSCQRLNSKRFEDLKSRIAGGVVQSVPLPSAMPAPTTPDALVGAALRSPYDGLPDNQFWRRAIERLPMADVNPVGNVRFKLSRDDRVATAGSCFAQHISRTLQKNGLNYYVSEHSNHLTKEVASQRNYGVFSARYGNLYTARQLVQLFDRAHGRFSPLDSHWVRSDGRLVDPFRPQIEADGFDSAASLESSRQEHFASVRELFEKLDVFVFTLGLTEAWRRRDDGAIFPLAPGVVAGEMSAERYEFVNFGVNEVVADMQCFIDRLLAVNQTARIILTVSPVPLIATYENQHVLVSTTYSKAVLRAAAGEIARRNLRCDYFPSYEIITGNFNKGTYFESDFRSVKAEGVDHVMRLFLSHYVGGDFATGRAESGGTSDASEIKAEMARVNDVVCEEEAIDPIGQG